MAKSVLVANIRGEVLYVCNNLFGHFWFRVKNVNASYWNIRSIFYKYIGILKFGKWNKCYNS